MFSTSDEYETALISERRAQGRYGAPRSRWPLAMFGRTAAGRDKDNTHAPGSAAGGDPMTNVMLCAPA